MRPLYRFLQAICQIGLVGLCGARVFGVRNVPQHGPALLVCNHQSFLDPVLAAFGIPRECSFMARDTLFTNPRFRKLITTLNAFPVKRGQADIGAIKETLRRLKRGELVVVFPEGTRTPDGRVHNLHAGVILLARKARAPLVPTLILGAFEAWPRNARAPRPHPIIVAYGRAVQPDELADRDGEQCAELIRERIVELMNRYRRHPLVAERLAPLPKP
ncbi:MAG: 1-acyl-sn-glycerol-3-phosphate acyltransferase [Planctomycetota bacterium]|nr:MAG: 1-acyl-sn-glycerol-3-phosphate acyltransferase [Planctomycetota bacterium]